MISQIYYFSIFECRICYYCITKQKNIPYREVSAKTGDNIKKLFEDMVKGTMTYMLNKLKKENTTNQTIRLSFLDKEEKIVKNERCC